MTHHEQSGQSHGQAKKLPQIHHYILDVLLVLIDRAPRDGVWTRAHFSREVWHHLQVAHKTTSMPDAAGRLFGPSFHGGAPANPMRGAPIKEALARARAADRSRRTADDPVGGSACRGSVTGEAPQREPLLTRFVGAWQFVPETRTLLFFALWPLVISIACRGTFKARASMPINSSFAAPLTGGAATRTRKAPSYSPAKPLREARSTTRHHEADCTVLFRAIEHQSPTMKLRGANGIFAKVVSTVPAQVC